MPGSSLIHPGFYNEGEQDYSHPEFPLQVAPHPAAPARGDYLPPVSSIDWTKPIQVLSTKREGHWADAVFIKNMEELGVCVMTMPNGQAQAFLVRDLSRIRNTPPPPRSCDNFINIYIDEGGKLFMGHGRHANRAVATAVGHRSRWPLFDTIAVHYVEGKGGFVVEDEQR